VEKVFENLESCCDRAMFKELPLDIGVVLETDDRRVQRKVWLPRVAIHAGLVNGDALVALEVRTYNEKAESHVPGGVVSLTVQ
jgi:hypothetical protein